MRWAVQSNLGCKDDHEQISEACKRIGVKCDLIPRVPFSKELPDIPTNELVIFYGSTRFVRLVFEAGLWTPCAFFDDEKFKTSHWGPIYGESWLNHGGKITTIAEFCFEPHQPDRLFFVRPDRDYKEFQGGVWSFGDIQRWKTGLLKADLEDEQIAHIPVLVAEPWGIKREWRLFMIDGQVCQSSQYRLGHDLNVSPNAPAEVLAFGMEVAKKFSPHDIFVLDICESAGNLYVLEVGCVNSAGFYACDIGEIVLWISLKIQEENYEDKQTK